MIASLSNSDGVGIDGFSLKLIKHVTNCLSNPLAEIFNRSIHTGVFPGRLKHAKITPVHKADDKLSINNYRSISILPVFSKVFEKLTHQRLVSFFIQKCNTICDNQYGFREKHSTYMALLNIIDQISTEMDNRRYYVGIFLDLSKAFDTIDHNILLTSLKYMILEE